MHDDGEGLQADLEALRRQWDRRTVLGWVAAVAVVGCVGKDPATDDSGDSPDTEVDTDTEIDGECAEIPAETVGPYPGDGSNGPNVLAMAGVVRSDIRASLSPATGTAAGVVLRVRMRIVDVADGCTPLADHAVYIWHCDATGGYSLYTVATENYLRGVQVTDADGIVEFTTTFPGCYPGRWPHIHFEVYPSLASTSAAANKLRTSQLAFPEAPCHEVYATAGYGSSATYLDNVSLSTDGVFRDGSDLQVAATTGNTTDGYVCELQVGV